MEQETNPTAATDADSAQSAAENYEKYRGKPPQEATTEERREEYVRLMDVVNNKGFKPGWAAYKFKELFGEWPPWEWKNEQATPAAAGSMSHCPHCGKSLAETSPEQASSESPAPFIDDDPPPFTDDDVPF